MTAAKSTETPISGTENGDRLYGSSADERVLGLGGNDALYGDNGNDEVFGGAGNDKLYGGNGDDILRGDAGISAGTTTSGTNLIQNGSFEDNLFQNVAYGAADNWTSSGFGGIDRNSSRSTDGGQYYAMGGWSSEMGNSISQEISLNTGQSYTLSFDMGSGHGSTTQTVRVEMSDASGVTMSEEHSVGSRQFAEFSETFVATSDDMTLTVTHIGGGDGDADVDNFQLIANSAPETVTQDGAGDDKLYGGSGNDQLYGGGGDDALMGSSGNDTADGGEGNDKVYGSSGNDDVSGGAGNDAVFGGSGNDNVSGGEGDDKVYGGSDDDVLDGGDGNDVLMAGSGNDEASGGDGDDVIYGAAGDDVVSGGAGNDAVFGGSGNDNLSGGDGDDMLYGAKGDDTFDGGAGDDYITAGSGMDTFIFSSGNDTAESWENGEQIIFDGVAEGDVTTEQVDDDVLITVGDDSLLLMGASVDDLADDLVFNNVPAPEPDPVEPAAAPEPVYQFQPAVIPDYSYLIPQIDWSWTYQPITFFDYSI